MDGSFHSDGKYRVFVRNDGAILVQPGDWLSKYAAAINKNPHQLGDFYWPPLSSTEDLRAIQEHEKDHLEVGDTVIHKPTWTKYWASRPGPRLWTRPEGMDRQTFLQALHEECGVQGERMSRISSLVTGAKWRDVSESSALGQLLFLIMGTNSGMNLSGPSDLMLKIGPTVPVETLSGAMGFLSIFQFTMQALVTLLDAQESALRFQGLRAIAYATTAFAYGDPVPVLPYGIDCNLRRGTWRGAIPLERYQRNWMDVASKTTMRLSEDVRTRGVDKQVYQTWIKWEANDRRQLAKTLMDVIAYDMSTMLPVDRQMFMSPPPVYPNDWRDDQSALCY